MRSAHFVFAVLLVLASLGAARADDLQVEATLDRTAVSVGEAITLQVIVQGGGDIDEPQLPNLAQFSVYPAGRAQNVRIVNGDVSASVTLTYLLTPRQAGTFTIGPVRVRSGGRVAASASLTVEVSKANAGTVPPPVTSRYPSTMPPGFPLPPAGFPVPPSFPGSPVRIPPVQAATPEPEGRGPAFLTAEVDTPSPVVGQTVTYSLKFYRTPGVSLTRQAQYPNTTGFLTEDLPPERTYEKVVDGRRYTVNEVRIAMVPTAEGHYEIGAAHLVCRVPFTFGDDDFDTVLSTASEKALETTPIAIDVRPLPDGRPADFTGGVGQFTLSANLDAAANARVGQPMNLELTVKGDGNIKMVQAPHLPAMPGFRVSDPVASTDTGTQDGKVSGTRKFTVVLVPTKDGKGAVPPVTMSYYDPSAGAYKTLTTKGIALAVAPGTVASGGPATSTMSTSGPKTDARGLRGVRDDAKLTGAPVDLGSAAGFRALQFVPLAVLVGALALWGPRFKRRARRPRPGDALRRAQASLRTVSEMGGLTPVLHAYLTERLGASVAGMRTGELLEALAARGVCEAEREQLARLLAAADQARYAPTQPPVRASIADAQQLLAQLERSLS